MSDDFYNVELWNNLCETLKDAFSKLNNAKIGFSIADTNNIFLVENNDDVISNELLMNSTMAMDDFDILFYIPSEIVGKLLDNPEKLSVFMDEGSLNFFCMANDRQLEEKGISEFLKELGFIRQRNCPIDWSKI